MLTTPQLENWPCYETNTRLSGLDWCFGATSAMENGHEIWYIECKEHIQVRFISDSSQGIIKIKIRFSGCTGDWEG